MAGRITIIKTRHVYQQMNMVGHNAECKQVILAAVQPPDFIHDHLSNVRLTQPGGTMRHLVQPFIIAPEELFLDFVTFAQQRRAAEMVLQPPFF